MARQAGLIGAPTAWRNTVAAPSPASFSEEFYSGMFPERVPISKGVEYPT